ERGDRYQKSVAVEGRQNQNQVPQARSDICLRKITHKPMINLRIEKVALMALNDTKPNQAKKAGMYLFSKAAQIVGRRPRSIAEATIVIMKYRATGSIWEG